MARKRACVSCGKRKWTQEHHVVWEQHGGEAVPSNLIPLCLACHYGYHARSVRIRVSQLPGPALDYAFARLGVYAHNYLLRRYDGPDERLAWHLGLAEEASERLPGWPEIPGELK